MPRHRLRLLLAALAAVPGLLAAPGCVVVAAGAAAGYGANEYIDGEYRGVLLARIDQSGEALERLAKDQSWEVDRRRRDATSFEMRAEDIDGRELNVTLQRQGGDATRVTVRVGVFGDEPASRRIIEGLRERLPRN